MILSINPQIFGEDLPRNAMPFSECRIKQLFEGSAYGV